MDTRRPMRTLHHDDGVDTWTMTRAAPAAALAGQIGHYSSYHERTTSFSARRELASTQVVLIVNLADPLELRDGRGNDLRLGMGSGFVAGIHTATAISRSTGDQAGVHVFLPRATLSRLLGMPLSEIRDRCVGLDDVLGPEARLLGNRLADTANAAARFDLLDALFARRLADAPPPDAAIAMAEARLSADPATPVAVLADDIGWSRQHFTSRFRAATGVSPSTFARLRRFETFCAAIAACPSADLADLAAAAGYYDQPHLTREVRDFAAMTPGELRRRLIPAEGGIRDG